MNFWWVLTFAIYDRKTKRQCNTNGIDISSLQKISFDVECIAAVVSIS